jgi:hypothetical protein
MGLRWMVVVVALVGCHSSVDLFGEDGGSGRDAGPAADFSVPADADRRDGSATACSGSAPKCYAGWGASSECCLEPGTDATCTSEGEWICPLDTFAEAECGRIDPVCEGIDGGRPPLYDECEVTSDCVLTGQYCCPTCGVPTAADYAAVNEEHEEDYYLNEACPEARTEEPTCPACPEGYNPYLTAVCDETGFRPACAVVDLEEDRFSACEGDLDCKLAVPDCCFCGDVSILETIAVRADVDINGLFCDRGESCDCDPVFDPAASAVCAEGRCTVVNGGTAP